MQDLTPSNAEGSREATSYTEFTLEFKSLSLGKNPPILKSLDIKLHRAAFYGAKEPKEMLPSTGNRVDSKDSRI